jgi:hypothetical protein
MWWLGAAIPVTLVLFFLGRLVSGRLGPATFEEPDDEPPVDPWEVGGDG